MFDKKKRTKETETNEWQQYQNGINYKTRINYYSMVDKHYRFLQGDQWGNTKSEGLPMPVFNIIKPVLNYKISQIFDKTTKILYQSGNREGENLKYLVEVASKLTDYAGELWESLKMDRYVEDIVLDGAVTGNGFAHFYYDTEEKELKFEQIDGADVYPADPNCKTVQEQTYIIISYRLPTHLVKEEAIKAREDKLNKLDNYEIDSIGDDEDREYKAGDSAKIEIEDYGKTTVLLKYWKEDGMVFCRKSTKNCVYVEKASTGMHIYPIAKFDWELNKNSFFGVSDVFQMIENQNFINTIASMIMTATSYSSFPKMIYNEDYIDEPDTNVGIAIGYHGTDINARDILTYANPGEISGAAFSMFQQAIDLTKDLNGANDSALGSVDPTKTSGRAILATMQQSQVPLERNRRRYFDFVEDIARIWMDIWYSTGEGKEIIAKDEEGKRTVYYISSKAFDELKAKVRIDVGPSERWSAVIAEETLQNLLISKYITFEMFIELLPDNGVLPKKKLQELLETEENKQIQEGNENPTVNADEIANQMLEQNTPDIESLVGNMNPEEVQQYVNNPDALRELIQSQMSNPS